VAADAAYGHVESAVLAGALPGAFAVVRRCHGVLVTPASGSPSDGLDGGVPERWVDERKVASHFGVSTRTIRRWRRAGMPSEKFRGARRYRLGDVQRWHAGRSS
jgi:hypothetical protein